ncbi:MAG: M23 family metallopeptidase [Acidimicrobiia bacterium]|nr:M23 family metallopeptidase [Acidimicrobiia bacterium]
METFAPGSGFGGHWGIDFAVPVSTPVAAVLDGTVTFAGRVVENLSVTVNHGGGVRTSYSFLSSIAVAVGDRVGPGDIVGGSGQAHGGDALHLSLRRGDEYRDPMRLLQCGRVPGSAVRLVSETGRRPLYAVPRAARHPWRNLRSTSRGSSHGGRSGAPSARPRRRHLHHRR